MTVEATPSPPKQLLAQGRPLDLSTSALGELRQTRGRGVTRAALLERLDADGYLYLPGWLDRDSVLATRRDLLERIAALGWLADGTRPDDAEPSQNVTRRMLNDVASQSGILQRLLYGGAMIELYELLFGEPVRHFDFTWLRAYPPGPGTGPHIDSVFMNRGTRTLLTAWVPLGNVDRHQGGLAILENSHRLEQIRAKYGDLDVDAYCLDDEHADAAASSQTLLWNGTISADPVALREELGLRWLTADFQAGDVLTFPIYTVHISLDNTTTRLRLSSDSRYQRASEPADPRWIGPEPSGHGSQSKIGVVC